LIKKTLPLKYNSSAVIIFELILLVISLVFYPFIKIALVPSSTHALWISSLAGISLGIFLFLSTYVFMYIGKSFRREIYEHHFGYIHKKSITVITLLPILIAVSEELFFRGLLVSIVGPLVSLLLFTIVHVAKFTDKKITFISMFSYGLLFYLANYFTGFLLTSIFAHYAFTLLRIVYFPIYIKTHPKQFKF